MIEHAVYFGTRALYWALN